MMLYTVDLKHDEQIDNIISDIRAGITHPQKVTINADRQQAIDYALSHAQAGDLVLIAGKGHEDYQEINGVRYHFDDAEIVKHVFAK